MGNSALTGQSGWAVAALPVAQMHKGRCLVPDVRMCLWCGCPLLPACSWVKLMEKEGKIAKFVPIDFTDPETVFDQCMAVSLFATLLVS